MSSYRVKLNQIVNNKSMDIACRKYNCRYNDSGICSRKNLNINNNPDCLDADIDMNREDIDVSRDMFCVEPDYAPYKHSKNINITCQCEHCLFNSAKACISNGIVVGADGNHPPCYSYMPK